MVKLIPEQDRRQVRMKLYADDVFLIAHDVVRQLGCSMSIEELFCSAEDFANFLTKNNLTEASLILYEVDDLKADTPDLLSYHLILAITYVKLSAMRRTKDSAEEVMRALVGFCQEYDGFTTFLDSLFRREADRWMEGKRVDLLTYELRCLSTDSTPEGRELVRELVDSCNKYTPDTMENVLNVLRDINDTNNHIFDDEVSRLREMINLKSYGAKEFIMVQNVENQINNVEPGATGVVKH